VYPFSWAAARMPTTAGHQGASDIGGPVKGRFFRAGYGLGPDGNPEQGGTGGNGGRRLAEEIPLSFRTSGRDIPRHYNSGHSIQG
jgi:hypothetical protein